MKNKLDKLHKAGLIGCLNNTGVNSENYKNFMKWINVKDELPKEDGLYLTYHPPNNVFQRGYIVIRFIVLEQRWLTPWCDEITHWMYLPEAPHE